MRGGGVPAPFFASLRSRLEQHDAAAAASSRRCDAVTADGSASFAGRVCAPPRRDVRVARTRGAVAVAPPTAAAAPQGAIRVQLAVQPSWLLVLVSCVHPLLLCFSRSDAGSLPAVLLLLAAIVSAKVPCVPARAVQCDDVVTFVGASSCGGRVSTAGLAPRVCYTAHCLPACLF
jgi:hypothetical protein